MRRSRSPSIGSLNLLLDTMCNAFGGVMFIALLLAIITRAAGQTGAATVSGEAASAERLKREIRRVEAEIRVRRDAWALIEGVRQGDLDALQAEKKRYDELLKQNRTIQSEVETSVQETERLRRAHRAVAEKRAAVEFMIRWMRAEAVRWRVVVRERRAAKDRILRHPQVHSSGKSPYWVIVKGGRLYPCYGVRSDDGWAPHGSVTSHPAGPGTRYEPREGAGQLVRDGFENSGYFKEISGRLCPDTDSVHFAVYPDSYAEFAQVRDQFLKSGFEYNWWPLGEKESVTLVPVHGVQNQ